MSIFGTANCCIIALRVLAETDTSKADPTATKYRKIFQAASSAPVMSEYICDRGLGGNEEEIMNDSIRQQKDKV